MSTPQNEHCDLRINTVILFSKTAPACFAIENHTQQPLVVRYQFQRVGFPLVRTTFETVAAGRKIKLPESGIQNFDNIFDQVSPNLSFSVVTVDEEPVIAVRTK